MENLQLTKLVRSVIRSQPKGTSSAAKYNFIATNKYKNCRTIKIYCDDRNHLLENRVNEALEAAGSTNHSIKKLPGNSWQRTGSFIVRLPL